MVYLNKKQAKKENNENNYIQMYCNNYNEWKATFRIQRILYKNKYNERNYFRKHKNLIIKIFI